MILFHEGLTVAFEFVCCPLVVWYLVSELALVELVVWTTTTVAALAVGLGLDEHRHW